MYEGRTELHQENCIQWLKCDTNEEIVCFTLTRGSRWQTQLNRLYVIVLNRYLLDVPVRTTTKARSDLEK